MRPYIALSPHPAAYVKAWKTVIMADNAGQNIRFTLDPHRLDCLLPQQARADFLKALHARINARAGMTPRGRCDDPDYFASARRDQHRLQDIMLHRIRFYQFETKEVKARFSHLLAHHDD